MVYNHRIRNLPRRQIPQEPPQSFNRRRIRRKPGFRRELDTALGLDLSKVSVLIPVGHNRRKPKLLLAVFLPGNLESIVLAGNLGLQRKMGMTSETEPPDLINRGTA
jgi:hypothetical protein